jgi:hypothetical protein
MIVEIFYSGVGGLILALGKMNSYIEGVGVEIWEKLDCGYGTVFMVECAWAVNMDWWGYGGVCTIAKWVLSFLVYIPSW